MIEYILAQSVLALGLTVGVLWCAWRFRLSAILLAVLVGVTLGPGLEIFRPDDLFGDALPALIGALLSALLCDEAMCCSLADLRRLDSDAKRLLLFGTLFSWVGTIILGEFLLDLGFFEAALVGGLLLCGGFRTSSRRRPVESSNFVVTRRWDTIAGDLTGTVLVCCALVLVGHQGSFGERPAEPLLLSFAQLVAGGLGIGCIAGFTLSSAFRKNFVPEFLRPAVSLLVILSAFGAGRIVAPGGGLLAVLVLGVFLASSVEQHGAKIFREGTRSFVVCSLVLLVVSRLERPSIEMVDTDLLLFTGVWLLLVRPLATAIGTLGGSYSNSERLLLALGTPRGLYALGLTTLLYFQVGGGEEWDRLLQIACVTGIVSVLWSDLLFPLGVRLSGRMPQYSDGVVILGAHEWARDIARAFVAAECRVILVDTNQLHVLAARRDGVPARCGNIFLEHLMEDLVFGGYGYLLALTSNDEVNTLAALQFAEILGQDRVFRLSIGGKPGDESLDRFRNPVLFGKQATFSYLQGRFAEGAAVRTVKPERELDILALRELYGKYTIPLFAISKTGALAVFTADHWPIVSPDQTLICLIDSNEQEHPSSGRVVYLRRG